MSETKKERLNKILKELRNVGGIEGASVISRDGLVIASDLTSVDAEIFAAMSAAMVGAAETATSELRKGNINQVIIEAQKGQIISIGAGKLAILVCLVELSTNLGLILLEMGKASGKINNLLGG